MFKNKKTIQTYNGNVYSYEKWLELYKQGYRYVNGNVDFSNNLLDTLIFSPVKVTGYFDIPTIL